MARSIHLKRAYDPPAPDDGARVLVERLWPRGVAKTNAKLDLWLKEIAPSTELRKWYNHDPERFDEFAARYRDELKREPGRAALERLKQLAAQGPVTLVFAAHDAERSNARVLRDLLMDDSAAQV